jgi:hypothetical protein
LFYLASAGKHLQERSALALLADTFQRFKQTQIPQQEDWSISAVDLWSADLEKDLSISEETGQQGSITLAYANVIARHGNRLSNNQKRLLQAIVLSSKLGLVVSGKDDAITALGILLSSVRSRQTEAEIKILQEDYNVIEWDDAFKAFDILGDAVPRTQFLSLIRQRVSSAYDEHGKGVLFASKASAWCDLLADLDCDFAEENKIFTREWRYTAITSNLDFLSQQIKMAVDRWTAAIAVDQPRGTIIYTYVEPNRVKEEVASYTKSLLRKASKEINLSALPILVVLLHDESGILGQSLAEYAVLEEINETEKYQFGHLVGAHQEKLMKSIRGAVDALIKKREYITALNEDMGVQRLSRVATGLFEKIYKRPITFPFDGFNTARGNAANTCYELTHELMHGKLDYNGITAKPIEVKNRATKVLRDTWGIFNQNGTISRRPALPVIRFLTEKWDDALSTNHKLPLSEAIKAICQPPFGANIASAGLFLGVFMASRYDKLVVMKNGIQIGTAQWLQENIFIRKYLNISALQNVDLLLLEEASSEWETLLDEWEQSEDYLSRINYLNRSVKLKQRTPIPPLLVYREESLREKGLEANTAVKSLEKKRDEAWKKIEKSQRFFDCSLVLWAASILKEELDKMINEQPLWTDGQIEEIEKDYISARQFTVQLFPDWLTLQTPASDSPSAIGDFKHKMIRVFGKSLKYIGLEEEYSQIESHTKKSVRNAELIAEAKETCRHIQAWISEYGGDTRIFRMVEVKTLKEKGRGYSATLQDIGNRVNIPESISLREPLIEIIQKLESAEKKLSDRVMALWDSTIETDEDMDLLAAEIDSLVRAFDGSPPNDLDDLLSMKKAIKIYRECYNQFISESLSWEDFDQLSSTLMKEYAEILEEEEVPWPPDEVIEKFHKNMSEVRQAKSQKWISNFDDRLNNVTTLTAAKANELMVQLQKAPLFLTPIHKKQLESAIFQIDKRLNDISVEWLVEKFKELSADRKAEFVERIKPILEKQN